MDTKIFSVLKKKKNPRNKYTERSEWTDNLDAFIWKVSQVTQYTIQYAKQIYTCIYPNKKKDKTP